MAWYTEGSQSSPSSGTCLASTGSLGADTYKVGLVASCSVAGAIKLRRKNSGGTVQNEQIIHLGAAQAMSAVDLLITSDSGDVVDVVTSGTIVGTVQASLFK